MAYLGNDLQVAFPVYRNIDDISGSFNSSTTSFPLRVSGVAPVPAPLYSQQCLISVGGVVQRPDDTGSEGFRLSGGNIIFASAPTTGADFFGVILAGADYINAGGNFPSGTAAVPSITFNDDLDTGIYNSGINQVSITTGGSERLRIDSAGQIESVSLGTAAAPAFSFTTDPNSGIYSPGADQVAISTGGSGRLFVDSSGNVGVGGSPTPYGTLTVFSSGIGGHINSTSGAAGINFYENGSGRFSLRTLNGSAGLSFYDTFNSTERLRITSAGLVGVGTSSPAQILHCTTTNGTASQLQFTQQFQREYRIGVPASSTSFEVYDVSAGASRLTIDSSGRLGVGTTPAQQLHSYSSTGSSVAGSFETNQSESYITFKASGTSTLTSCRIGVSGESIVFLNNGANERARIDSSGRLGIGTSSPSEILDCKGNIVLGAQNAAGASLQPTSASGTDIAGSALILRSGRSTGSGSSGLIQILPSAGSTVSGTTVRNNSDSGFHMKYSPSGWNDHAVLGLLTVALGSSIAEANRSGLTGDATVFTIDGCDTSSQSALEIIATNNGTDGTQGFIRFFGSGSKNPYATIAAVTPGVNYTSGNLAIRTYNAGVEGTVATFTNTGRLGIGTTTVNAKLEVAGGNIRLDNNQGVEWGGSNNYIYGNETTDFVAIATNGNERCRLDSSGRLLVGTSSARSVGVGSTYPSRLEVETTSYAGLSIVNNTNDAIGAILAIGKSRGTAVGGVTSVTNGDEVGVIRFAAADGTDIESVSAQISCEIDAAASGNDVPGRLVFSTCGDGASSPTERMRITNAGGVCFATTAVGASNSDSASFNTAGYFSINHVNGKVTGSGYVGFNYNAGEIGSITQNGTTAVAYNTVSDYRLKENVVAFTDGITRLQQLKPSRFNFIADPERTVDGFLAHEVQDVVPEAIHGEKDAVDEEGNPKYQGIDQSKLVPLLTAALQEAVAKIESLEARLTAAGL